MLIAIPTFQDRVSPRFDCARAFLLVEVVDNRPEQQQELVADQWPPFERVRRLADLGAEAVLCGGVDCCCAEALQAAGIDVYAGITGDARQALDALLRGELVEALLPALSDRHNSPGTAGPGRGRGRGAGPGGGSGMRCGRGGRRQARGPGRP